MNIIEIVLLILVIGAIIIAVCAQKAHLTFKAEASKDLEASKVEITKLKNDVASIFKRNPGPVVSPPGTPTPPKS